MKSKLIFRISLLIVVLVAAAMAVLAFSDATATTPSQVAFIDVGQGDSALLSDGSGFDVLIDGGLSSKAPTVVAFLRAQGIDDIDVMVASHADADHIGGLIDVLALDDMPVRAVVFNGYTGTTDTWTTFAAAVAAEGLVMTPAAFPGTFQWGLMQVQVLNPVSGLSNPDTNDVSVVLLVNDGSKRFLFAGDIDAAIEAAVVARGTPVAAEVLKVAHHGSNYSSSAGFLAAVQPQDTVISVGPNSYGHPGAETLARLAAAGATIYRTDLDGTIIIRTDFYRVHLPLVVR